jgi:hypothetical protein
MQHMMRQLTCWVGSKLSFHKKGRFRLVGVVPILHLAASRRKLARDDKVGRWLITFIIF